MRILRFRKGPESPVMWGWLAEDRIGLLDGSPFAEFRRGEAHIALDSVELLAPVQPSKIVCLGKNYIAHAAEFGSEVPELPLLFLKPPSAVIGPGETILLPPQSERVEHEAEMAIIIGQRGRWISPGDISEHILGYTVANDVTARDLQFKDDQWTRGKGFDTFCPLGPWIETELDPADVMVTCLVNGQLRQMASTRDMVFPVTQLVGFISSVMTLEPGDVILTGTPAGVGPLVDGDEVSVEIEGVGTLINPVRAATRLR
ncbi:MAG TPA: fumarylacetoacetate hydrolase family protein [Anaerolineae bacterium]|nr:fumarylacetoacetate hydrolase family protein [Anaerolineae bacterium]